MKKAYKYRGDIGNGARFSCLVCIYDKVYSLSVLHLPKALSLKKQILTMKGV